MGTAFDDTRDRGYRDQEPGEGLNNAIDIHEWVSITGTSTLACVRFGRIMNKASRSSRHRSFDDLIIWDCSDRTRNQKSIASNQTLNMSPTSALGCLVTSNDVALVHEFVCMHWHPFEWPDSLLG